MKTSAGASLKSILNTQKQGWSTFHCGTGENLCRFYPEAYSFVVVFYQDEFYVIEGNTKNKVLSLVPNRKSIEMRPSDLSVALRNHYPRLGFCEETVLQ